MTFQVVAINTKAGGRPVVALASKSQSFSNRLQHRKGVKATSEIAHSFLRRGNEVYKNMDTQNA